MSVKYKDQTIAGRTIAYLLDADVYSTEETVVGRWIDGKPVYRRTIVGTTGSTDGDTNLTNSGDIDTFVSMVGTAISPSSGDPVQIPYAGTDPTNRLLGVFRATVNDIYIFSQGSMRSAYFEVAIEYTKTTDTATIAIPTTAEMAAAYEEGVQTA